jgi:hypothetical protein
VELGHAPLDPALAPIVELPSARLEDLDAVVLGRIVRGRDDERERGAAALARPGETRRREDARADDARAASEEPGDEGRLEHGTARARIAADEDARVSLAGALAAELGEGAPEALDLGGSERPLEGATADPVRPEEPRRLTARHGFWTSFTMKTNFVFV